MKLQREWRQQEVESNTDHKVVNNSAPDRRRKGAFEKLTTIQDLHTTDAAARASRSAWQAHILKACEASSSIFDNVLRVVVVGHVEYIFRISLSNTGQRYSDSPTILTYNGHSLSSSRAYTTKKK